MSPIEKHLQALLEISPDGLPVPLEDTPVTEKELFQLVSLGLVQKHDRSDGGWWVNPTESGISYFLRRDRDLSHRRDLVWTSVISAAVASVVTVLLQFLISRFL